MFGGESGEPRPWLFLCLSGADIVSLKCILLPVMRDLAAPQGWWEVLGAHCSGRDPRTSTRRGPHIFEHRASLLVLSPHPSLHQPWLYRGNEEERFGRNALPWVQLTLMSCIM